MAPEQKIQKQITDYLTSLHAYHFKVITATKKGILDVTVCLDGKFIGIEVKTPKTMNTVSALQAYNIEKIEKAGGIAFVASSVEDVKFYFRLNKLIS